MKVSASGGEKLRERKFLNLAFQILTLTDLPPIGARMPFLLFEGFPYGNKANPSKAEFSANPHMRFMF